MKQLGSTAGNKWDGDKLRLDLIPPSLSWAVGSVLTFGAQKYGDRNWEAGIEWNRCYGALLRHLTAWWGGENLDPESGKSHLWHAACCLTFLIEFEQTHPELDNRPKRGPKPGEKIYVDGDPSKYSGFGGITAHSLPGLGGLANVNGSPGHEKAL